MTRRKTPAGEEGRKVAKREEVGGNQEGQKERMWEEGKE